MPTNDEIRLRDSFIVPVADEGLYYMYGTARAGGPFGTGGSPGFDVYVGRDLTQWEGPFPVFAPLEGFWATRDFWAPEVHPYEGRFYMFASFKAEGACRGTQILVAETPRGPFRVHSPEPVTPRDWECLDGTLYRDETGAPWIVYCHEWVQVGDGEICATPLTADLRAPAGEPMLLFRASAAPWVVSVRPGQRALVTDGPCLHRTADGALLMLWSSFVRRGAEGRAYAVGVACSQSGTLAGPWVQAPTPLYDDDGGHGSVFRALDGRLMLALHRPNRTPDERPRFIPLREADGMLFPGR